MSFFHRSFFCTWCGRSVLNFFFPSGNRGRDNAHQREADPVRPGRLQVARDGQGTPPHALPSFPSDEVVRRTGRLTQVIAVVSSCLLAALREKSFEIFSTLSAWFSWYAAPAEFLVEYWMAIERRSTWREIVFTFLIVECGPVTLVECLEGIPCHEWTAPSPLLSCCWRWSHQ